MFPVNVLPTTTDQLSCGVIRPLHCSFIVIIFISLGSVMCSAVCYILWKC